MTMADVLSVTLILLGILITLPGLWLVERALFPAWIARARRRIEDRPGRTLLVGLLPAAALFVLPLVLLNRGGPTVKLLGMVLLLGGFVVAGAGLAALASLVGDRLPSPADADRPWRSQVRGSVCLELAFLLPLAGWFAVLPLSLCVAAGAALPALWQGAAPRARVGGADGDAAAAAAV